MNTWDEMRELLADSEHERWSRWMRYLFSKGTKNEDGSFTIDKASVERWERQMRTAYPSLTEKEKDSDRSEAERTMKIVGFTGVDPLTAAGII